MDSNIIIIDKRKEKIKNWLKDPYNFVFSLILLLSIGVRLYYFWLTKDQPLWWDESDYMAYAKNLAGYNVFWTVTAQHSSLYPYLASIFFRFGFSEFLIKLTLQIIPSILSVVLVYFISLEMYKDKRIGLIASFLMGTFWVHLFNSMRFHVGILALFFGLLSIYIFWVGYENKRKIFGRIDPRWTLPLTMFFVVLTYSIRRGYFLFGFFFLVYILLTKDIKRVIKDKYVWLSGVIGVPLILLAEGIIFGNVIEGSVKSYVQLKNKISLLPFDVFKSFFNNLLNNNINILYYLFLIGTGIIILNLFISFGHIKKSKELKSDLFNFIIIIIVLSFFIFVLRIKNDFGEPRWYLPIAFSTFICISKASIWISDFFKNYGKYISLGLIIIMIGYGGYYELNHGSNIIKFKIPSFEGIKQAGLYIKEVSNENDLIIVRPQPQTAYYSERKVIKPRILADWEGNKEEMPFDVALEKIKDTPEARYILITFSEPNHPKWMRNDVYVKNPQNGQIKLAKWEIPFMNTTIDFTTGKQDIKQFMKYGNITFRLLTIKQNAFVYEIIRGE